MSKVIKSSIWVLIIVVFALAGYAYWEYSSLHPSTDDAYVDANVVNVAAQVSGPVAKIYVSNNEYVKKGQLLFTIDQRPFKIAVAKARADLALTGQQVAAAEAAVETAKANLALKQAQLEVAQKNVPRTLDLVAKGQASQAMGVSEQGKLESAQAAYNAAQGQYEQAKQQLGQLGKKNARVREAEAALAQAKLDLQYTDVHASGNGRLVNFKLRPGTMIAAGQPLFALVETNQWWVNANFKETDLDRIRPGQPVSIEVDIYPEHKFKGVVQSISYGSGSAFSIMPPENATGNWVKVTQRFPVKIMVSNASQQFPLRVGASSSVTINTRQTG